MTRDEVEQAQAQLRAEGLNPTYEAILAKLGGGSRRDLSTILAELRAGEGSPESSEAAMPEPSAAQRLAEAEAARKETMARAAALRLKIAEQGLLTPEEEGEGPRLEKRLEGLQPYIVRLRREAEYEAVLAAVTDLEAQWAPLVEQKVARYRVFGEAIRAAHAAYLSILDTHRAQVAVVRTAPEEAQVYWEIPDVGTLATIVVSHLPRGWREVLFRTPETEVVNEAKLMEWDPCTRPLRMPRVPPTAEAARLPPAPDPRLPLEFPTYRYHPHDAPRIVQSLEDLEALEAADPAWRERPYGPSA